MCIRDSLGSIFSADGIRPDPDKVQAVAEWPRPRNLTEVRSFVALASYYSRHIRSFAEIARPLHELTKKHARFDCVPRQEDSFLSLKYSLTNAPVLAMPLDDGGFVLDTDANQFSMGCVLQQVQDGVLNLRKYSSRGVGCSVIEELKKTNILGTPKPRQNHVFGEQKPLNRSLQNFACRVPSRT